MKKNLLAISIIALSACSGDGGGSKSTPPVVLAGQLNLGTAILNIDGLGFKTATIDSTTTNGQFSYVEGEDITFTLGNTELFSVKASETISFSDAVLKDTTLPTTAEEVIAIMEDRPGMSPSELHPLHTVSNTIKLLLVLDDDKNSSNGLNLTDWHTKLSNTEINLNTRLDNNLVFYKTFQEALIAPLAMDIAEPLLYLYNKLNIKVPAKQLSTVVKINDGTRSTYDYAFEISGHLKKREELRHTISSNEDTDKDIEDFSYNKFGQQTSYTTTRIRSINTSSESTNYDREINEYSTYLSNNSRTLSTLEKSYAGTDLDNLVLSKDAIITYNKNKILTRKGTNISEDTRSLKDNTYTYNSEGQLIQEKSTDTRIQISPESLLSEITSITNTSYETSDNSLTSTVAIDSDNDGAVDRNNSITLIFDDKKTITSRTFLNKAGNAVTYHLKRSYLYDSFGNVKTETSERDDDKDGVTFDRTEIINNDNYSDLNVINHITRFSQPAPNNGTPVDPRLTEHKYSFVTDGKGKGLFNSIISTEQTWTAGTAVADRPAPFRTITYSYEYDPNSGLLTTINANQIFNGVENDRRRATLSYDQNSLLSQYNYTLRLDGVGGTEKTVTTSITYTDTDDGLGYLLNNQQSIQLNRIIANLNDYTVIFKKPSLIKNPND